MTSPTIAATRPQFARALPYLAAATSALVLIQAVFAGRGLFINTDELNIHGILGNISFVMALSQVGFVLLAGYRGPAKAALLGMSVSLVVLMVAQLGLGYSGRDGGQPAAWHVPNGVLIFGLTVGLASAASRYVRLPASA